MTLLLRVQGLGFRIQDLGFRVVIMVIVVIMLLMVVISMGLSLDLRPLTLWDSLILLLWVPKGFTLSRGPKCHIEYRVRFYPPFRVEYFI